MKPTEDITEKIWNTIAESFDSTRKKPWQQVLSFVSSHASVDCLVDIGCGNGRHLIPSSSYAHHCIGIDFSRSLLKITKKHIASSKPNISLIHASARKIPLGDSTVDILLYIASLHNIYGRNNRIQSLKEVARVLKPEGNALITVWSKHQPQFTQQLKQSRKIMDLENGDIYIYWRQHNLNIPRYYHLYDKEEFINDIQESSLALIEYEEITFGSKIRKDNYIAIVQRRET